MLKIQQISLKLCLFQQNEIEVRLVGETQKVNDKFSFYKRLLRIGC